MTLVLVERIMQVILGLPERVVVLDHGEKIAEGPPAAVVADPAVIEAVEQNARRALDVASRGYVLEAGCLKLEGGREHLLADPYVQGGFLR